MALKNVRTLFNEEEKKKSSPLSKKVIDLIIETE
jgi:hypothetical protein